MAEGFIQESTLPQLNQLRKKIKHPSQTKPTPTLVSALPQLALASGNYTSSSVSWRPRINRSLPQFIPVHCISYLPAGGWCFTSPVSSPAQFIQDIGTSPASLINPRKVKVIGIPYYHKYLLKYE